MIYLLCMSALQRQPSAPTLYAQVHERLLERIRRDFAPGQLLPTQQELALEFGASLITIKRALHDLAVHGLPEESLYAWLRRQHRLVPRRADEEVTARPPLPREAKFLGSDVPIVLVIRRHTRLADGRPLEVAEMAADARHYRYR